MSARRFLRDSLGIAASQYLARAALLGRGVVAAAALGPRGYGGWNALNLILDYGAYASAGAVQGLDLRAPAAVASGARAEERRLLAGAWAAVLAGGAAFAAALVAYLASGRRALAAPFGAGPALLMLAAALFQLAFQYHASALRARGLFTALGGAQATQAVVGAGLGIALVARFGVWGLVGGWIAGTLSALAIVRRAAPDVPLRPGAPSAARDLVRAGAPVFLFFAATLVLRSVDRLAFLRFGDTRGLGLYSIGLMATGLVLYLPESAAFVIFPRVTAAAHGARDRDRTWNEVRRLHRGLAAVLPLVVALGMIWAGPVVERLLPAYADGVPALRVLAVGALMLSASTVPAYFLLGSGRPARLLPIGAGAAALNAALVFGTAARDPRPVPIAAAAATGYAAFAVAMVVAASRRLFADLSGRASFALASFVPALSAGALALAACRYGPPGSAAAALARSVAVTAVYLPVLWWFARGVGLRGLARDWVRLRRAAA